MISTRDLSVQMWALAKRAPLTSAPQNDLLREAARRLEHLADAIPIQDAAEILASCALPPTLSGYASEEIRISEWEAFLRALERSSLGGSRG